MHRSGKGIPIQWLMASTIILCLLAMLSVVIVQGYRGVSTAMVSAADDSARQLAALLNERARRLIVPAENVIHVLAHDRIGAAGTLQERRLQLPVLAQTLRSNPMLSAVYIGYDNGEFLLLRPLQRETPRIADAPEDAEFLLQSIAFDEQGQLHGRWLFLDAELQLHSERSTPDYWFDPRQRPWYQQVETPGQVAMTDPYVFFTTGEIGMSLAMRSHAGAAVIGMDAAVDDLTSEVRDLRLTSGTELAIFDEQVGVIAYPEPQRIIRREGPGFRLASLQELGVAPLERLAGMPIGDGPVPFAIDGDIWYGLNLPLRGFDHSEARILIAIPAWELLSEARELLVRQAIWAGMLICAVLLLGLTLGHRLGRSIKQLAGRVEALGNFDFSPAPRLRSHIREVNDLQQTTAHLAQAIGHFQAITLCLSRELELERMLPVVLQHLVEVAEGISGVVYLCDEENDRLERAAVYGEDRYPASFVLSEALPGSIEQALAEVLKRYPKRLILPLHDRKQVLLGVLSIRLSEQIDAHGQDYLQHFLHSLSGALAVAIETRQLFDQQQALLESVIKVLAHAVDAKSPYTGGHCERVPQLAELLLAQAAAAQSGSLADYQPDEEERYAFRIAAWLHDCGKITSPEYVVDKATKLETLYNRIHEIRTRFEVLHRDAQLLYWQGRCAGDDEQRLGAALQQRQQQLQRDFAIVASANIGRETMSDELVAELQRIGGQTWLRHFDNRLGLSAEECLRLAEQPSAALPAEECLLADRPEQLIAWGSRKPPVQRGDPRNIWGFDMQLPEYAYNLGELHNLSVRRGTLTVEERFKVNEHIVHTLVMLSTLPFPRALRQVPDIAANHHEKLDGTGYPRRLGASQLSIPARIMAIADIFEALTAADRPYKTPKTLSESIAIMMRMAHEQHIDAELFALFLSSGAYLHYARQYLQPQQIDQVDIDGCLAQLRGCEAVEQS
ncbi:HD domain-containing phosphohydrolase [Pseudomonas sp. MYb185]|uniref:HD domain-containing phosphohydrolase n=1 Tax=Pseudomonas sp. MYb185 TaxID=1848729 RepID=UPI000CFC37AC|nr:HD domain-containing phosphohydrolase [Pseudomonas sp. MYb185]PRB83791.1 phosphohydrolase [Pseudomonas sp. MYb185]